MDYNTFMVRTKNQQLNMQISERINYLINDKNIQTNKLSEELSEELKRLNYEGKLPIKPQLIATWRKGIKPNNKVLQAFSNIFNLPENYFITANSINGIDDNKDNNRYYSERIIDTFKDFYKTFPMEIPEEGKLLLSHFPISEFEYVGSLSGEKKYEIILTKIENSFTEEEKADWMLKQQDNYPELKKFSNIEFNSFVRYFHTEIIKHKKFLDTLKSIYSTLNFYGIYNFSQNNFEEWPDLYLDEYGIIDNNFWNMISENYWQSEKFKSYFIKEFPELKKLENTDDRIFFEAVLRILSKKKNG